MKRLVWTADARADLDSIAKYYAETDPRVGDMLIGRIEEAAEKLARRDTGRPGRIAGTREKSVAKTARVVIYEVHGNLLMIFRVLHTARRWP